MAKNIFAFVHIEKTGGTSLNHTLRHLFFLQFANVRPLSKESQGMLTEKDLEVYEKIIPKLKCIAGHSIHPMQDFGDQYNMKFITLFRDPVQRYLSHYVHWVEKKGLIIPFDDFLKIETFKNYQVKKICGEENSENAIHILKSKFLHYGHLEKMDYFLSELIEKMGLNKKNIFNYKINESLSIISKKKLLSEYRDRIISNNIEDIKLLNYVRKKINKEINTIHIKKSYSLIHFADFALRKLYIDPVSNSMRKKNGIRKDGSY